MLPSSSPVIIAIESCLVSIICFCPIRCLGTRSGAERIASGHDLALRCGSGLFVAATPAIRDVAMDRDWRRGGLSFRPPTPRRYGEMDATVYGAE